MRKLAVVRASDAAYERLKDDIIQWRLAPGAPLGEIETAQRLGVSRTPLREALSRLTAEGLVSTDGGRTAIVTPVSIDDLRSLFEYRESLETQAARLAATRRNLPVFEKLHEQLVRLTTQRSSSDEQRFALSEQLDDAIDNAIDNRYLVGAIRELRSHLARYRRHAAASPGRLAEATKEHRLIVDAIIAGDSMLAAQATSVHLHNSLADILATVPMRHESPETSA